MRLIFCKALTLVLACRGIKSILHNPLIVETQKTSKQTLCGDVGMFADGVSYKHTLFTSKQTLFNREQDRAEGEASGSREWEERRGEGAESERVRGEGVGGGG